MPIYEVTKTARVYADESIPDEQDVIEAAESHGERVEHVVRTLAEDGSTVAEPVDGSAGAALTAALAHLAGVFGDLWTAGYTGTHMTCGEADALARVLALAGHRDDAARWLMGHADGDDDARHTELAIGDHDSRKAADIAEFLALAAARAYVAKLTRE